MASNDDLSEVEKHFLAKWDHIEKMLVVPHAWPHLKLLVPFIAELRQRRYDRSFLIERSMHLLILSRCRFHRSDEQPFLVINLSSESKKLWVSYYHLPQPHVDLQLDRIEVTPEVEELLARLLAQPIT